MGTANAPTVPTRQAATNPRLALALGGGGARALAHTGVLDVLEREGLRPSCIAGTSMGGLVGALSAVGLGSSEILDVSHSFRFPRWFLPGALLSLDSVFGSAIMHLSGTFEAIRTRLLLTAVDLESGDPRIMRTGRLLPAVRATCAVPGVVAPERIDGRWLVDGSLVNPLPIDAAWLGDPDVVIAVQVGSPRLRRIPQLDWRLTRILSRVGRRVPNPATAKISYEVLLRASEIVLAHETALRVAMTGAEILIEPELGDVGMRDFGRADDCFAAGRRAAEAALPEIERALSAPAREPREKGRRSWVGVDPVCSMVVSSLRARASAEHHGERIYFCSPNCRDLFLRSPTRYPGPRALRRVSDETHRGSEL